MLDGGGHRDPSTRIFGGHKLFYDGQWPLAGLYVLSLSLRIGLSAGYTFTFPVQVSFYQSLIEWLKGLTYIQLITLIILSQRLIKD